jgi:hypothetical protein
VPLSGGSSDQFGGRFQDRWTAHCIFDVLRDRAVAIRLEPPPAETEGFEFWIRFANQVAYHQVKRQVTGEGRWTLSALRDAGVLRAFAEKLSDHSAHCVFTSAHAAPVLEELADRASRATGLDDFDRHFLSETSWRTHFQELSGHFGDPLPATVWDWLRRIRVETIGEEPLKALVGLEAELLLDGNPDGAVAALVDVLRENTNRFLTASDIWRELEPHGYRPNRWSQPRLAAAVAGANEEYRSSRVTTLIRGELIERPDVTKVREEALSNPVVFVDGRAGTGKSDVLLGLAKQLEADGIPHLALRLDQRTPTTRPLELGAELGLPGSPPAALAKLAQGEPAVLIVDQLDFVSSISGRGTKLFECVSTMLDLAAADPNLHVVLACRTFDLENDAHLRQLNQGERSARLTVGNFDDEQVRATTARLGYPADALRQHQLALLSLPLHLALLAEIADTGAEPELSFDTARELFEHFWTHKRRAVRDAIGHEPAWTNVLGAFVDYMSANQVLRAPREVVDEWEGDAEAMASAHVLVREEGRYGFFHEAFFDYVFARRFVNAGGTLEDLLADDQALFRRAQVRQILAYERAGSHARYPDELSFVVHSPSVRLHLKDVVLAWLGEVEPMDGEWQVVAPLLREQSGPLFNRALRLLRVPAWFDCADRHGTIEVGLDGDLVEPFAWLLSQLDAVRPARVAELLAERAGKDEAWAKRARNVLSFADISKDRSLFELFVETLEDDERYEDRLGTGDFWYVAHALPDEQPDWACELLGRYLAAQLRRADAAGVENPFNSSPPFLPRGVHLREFAVKAAEAAPVAYAEFVWSAILDLATRAEHDRSDYGELYDSDVWNLRHFDNGSDSFDDELLVATEVALRTLAGADPERCERLLEDVWETENEAVCAFIFEAFAGNPERFADRAVEFLVSDPRRLRVGWSNEDHWATRRLLEAVTPHCSDDALERLEKLLLAYYTSWERTPHGRSEFGSAQFALLGGIAEDRRSPAVRKRFAEHQRKFNRDDAEGPEGILGGFVGSPLPASAREHMTDEQWRGAIASYDSDDFQSRRDFLKGGAIELSRDLQQRAIEEPERFARFALTLPDETHVAYFEAVLHGVGRSADGISLELAHELMARCHRLPGQPCGRYIAYPLRPHATAEIPAVTLEIVTWYAINDPHPADDRTEPKENGRRDDLSQHGLNSVRGGVAYEITRLVYTEPANFAPLRKAVESLVTDDVMAVRAMAAETVLALLRHHPADAQALFQRLTEDADPRLFTSQFVGRYLNFMSARDFAALRPLLEQMLTETDPAVREAGAVYATLASLDEEEAGELADRCLTGDDAEREGVAKVYAGNLTSARYRERCEMALAQLFNDPVESVRKAAGSAIRHMRDDSLGEFESLGERYVKSPTFEEDPEDLLLALTQTTAQVPWLATLACERVIDRIASQGADIRTKAARYAHEVTDVLMRAYANAEDTQLRERILDAIDQSLANDFYGMDRLLGEHDRL